MPVYQLTEEIAFPRPEMAEEGGLLAVGGDLSPGRLLLAYAQGIFPWPHRGHPLLWFSPDPRMVLPVEKLRISRSLRKTLRSGRFEVRFDHDFPAVIRACAEVPRRDAPGTWITEEMIEAYTRLHELGFAHSAESYQDGALAGGLYGISLGGMFCGESMFARCDDASKVAFATLVGRLRELDFAFVDAQVHTPHLARFGAEEIPRERYLSMLEEALQRPIFRGSWREII